MKRIAYLAPNLEKLKKIKESLKEYEAEIHFEVGSLNAGLTIAKKLIDQGIEVIIARGETAFTIRDHYPEVVIVDVPISGIDLALALEKSRQFGEQVAVVSFASMIKQVELLEAPLGIKIRKYELPMLPTEKDINKKIDEALSDGANVLLGGFSTGRIAEQRALPYVEIPTSDIAYIETFFHARSLLKSIEQEKMRGEFIRAVLNHSHEGILSVDMQGKINLINPVAEQILQYKESRDSEKTLKELCPGLSMVDVLRTGEEALSEIHLIHSMQVLCNKVPIKNNRKVIGGVVTLQDITKIQEMESQIRKELYAKGHVAQYHFSQMIAFSRTAQQTIEVARNMAKSDANVIIYGETGAGKEVFAQSIHSAGRRASGPFVAVNCASFSTQLLESELLGYVEGAFPGAQLGGKKGFFEIAHGGTLFLDEIGEMDYVNQGRLLRVLQERSIIKLGSDQVVSVDIRIIASTKKNLWADVQNGSFREDLYYRLNVLELQLPTLRERKKDIPFYAQLFLTKFAKESEKNMSLSPGALRKLSEYPWPGNLRELRNMMERLAAISVKEHLTASDVEKVVGQHMKKKQKISEKEKQEISEIYSALERRGWEMQAVAEDLLMSRVTLWRKMKKFGIEKNF